MFVYLKRLNLILDFIGLKFLREEYFEDLNAVKKEKKNCKSERKDNIVKVSSKQVKKHEVFAMKYVWPKSRMKKICNIFIIFIQSSSLDLKIGCTLFFSFDTISKENDTISIERITPRSRIPRYTYS